MKLSLTISLFSAFVLWTATGSFAEGSVRPNHLEPGKSFTSLRIAETPVTKVISSKRRSTLYMTVIVRNAGEAPAEGVQVIGKLPDDTSITLQGPHLLSPNEKARYRIAKRNIFVNPSNIHFLTRCSNCRR